MKKIRTIFKRFLAPILSVALMVGYLLPFASCGSSTLAKAYKKYFPIGVALDVDSATGEFFYDDEFVSEFASITAGNEMKWKYTENKKGEYTWELGDYVVGKAEELGMKVRGHVLVWRDSTPDYVVRDSRESDPAVAKAKVLDDIRSHVTATIQHFGDDPVYCWDVVNEAISDSNDPNEIYYPCPLYEGAGEDYIFEAFVAARQANPNIKLYYNDYNLNQPVKRAKAIAMIKKMQERGIPIDGIGEQGHYNIRNFDFVEFENMLNDFRELNLDVQITELDFSVYENDSEAQLEGLSPELEALQAEAYGKVLEICRKNSDIITGVTLWGGADDKTWLDNFPVKNRKNYPLLFDEFCDKKAAYYAVMDFKNKFKFDEDKKEDPMFNVDDGKQADFHFGNWYGDFENSGFDVISDYDLQGETVTKVHYAKLSDYTQVQTKVHGALQKYKYINLTLSADKSTIMMPQINYNTGYGETYDKLIGEETFEVSTTPKTYSVRIPDSRRLYMDLVEDVWLFPEPGEVRDFEGKLVQGDFYIHDSWFSETAPAGAEVFEPTGGSSGVSEKAYKRDGQYTWYNETSWTKYKVGLTSGGVKIASTGAADWGFVSVQLSDFEESHNKLKFSYIDNSEDGNSVSYIRFRLRGTPIGMTNDGINTYMEYKDKDLVDWVCDVQPYTQPSAGGPESVTVDPQTGRVDIVYDISNEIRSMLASNAIDLSDDGYGLRLVILIETVGVDGKTGKNYAPKYPNNYSIADKIGEYVEADKKFDITVVGVQTYTETQNQ